MKKLLAVVAVSAFALQAGAAVISWSSGTVTDDNDVRTDGTLFAAENAGTSTPTVNGVFFDSLASSGNISYSAGGSQYEGSYVGVQPGLSTAYSNLLDGVTWDDSDLYTITFTNLSVGQDYLIQIWTSTGQAKDTITDTFDDGNGNKITLSCHNPAEYTVATFTADAASQSITEITSDPANENPFFNAVQIREVPEAASVGMIGVGAGLLLAFRRLVRV